MQASKDTWEYFQRGARTHQKPRGNQSKDARVTHRKTCEDTARIPRKTCEDTSKAARKPIKRRASNTSKDVRGHIKSRARIPRQLCVWEHKTRRRNFTLLFGPFLNVRGRGCETECDCDLGRTHVTLLFGPFLPWLAEQLAVAQPLLTSSLLENRWNACQRFCKSLSTASLLWLSMDTTRFKGAWE